MAKKSRNTSNLVFIMIKPWCLNHSDEILEELDRYGERLKIAAIQRMPLELIAKQYQEHEGQHFFESMVNDHQDKPAIIALYCGDLEIFKGLKTSIRDSLKEDISLHSGYSRDAFHMTINQIELNRDLKIWEGYFK